MTASEVDDHPGRGQLIGSDGDPALFETLVRDNPDMIAVIDLDGRFTFVSEAVRRILGLDPADLVGRDGFALIHPDDIGVAAESLGSTVAGGDGVREPLLLRLRHADSSWREVEILTHNLSSDERIAGLVITARDMAARRQSERTAREARDLFEQAFDRAPIGMAIVETDGALRRVNAALASILGSTVQDLVGDDLVRLAHRDDRHAAADQALSILGGEDRSAIEVRFVRVDGGVAWARVTATLICSEDGSPLHAIVQVEDVTEQERLRRELHRAATHDPLTGLLNRAGLEANYDRFLDGEVTASAFLLVDLDGFKPVNDTYGHAVGDRLLQCIAGRLKVCLRDDATVARIGGDEFVAHVGDVADVERAQLIGERVRESLASPFGVEGHEISISGSVGVAFVAGPVDLESALIASDRAAYRAKHSGGNRVTVVRAGGTHAAAEHA